jgi:asparagine synthase (glutamine-hydrolysing)
MGKSPAAILAKIHAGTCYLRLSKVSRAVRREGLTYLSPVKLHQMERELARINRAQVPGDVAEFGLALGGSGIVLASLKGKRRHFHGFDVFGMIPPPNSAKDGAKSAARYEEIVSGKSSGIQGKEYYGYRNDLYEAVQDSFRKMGEPIDGVTNVLHQGLFEDSWPKAADAINQLALVHIDCDWYDPVIYCLTQTATRLAPGGAIIIDDYFAYPGAKSATDEFLARNPAFVVTGRNRHLIMQKRT